MNLITKSQRSLLLQVKVWFQNRRTKHKREQQEQEQMQANGNKGLGLRRLIGVWRREPRPEREGEQWRQRR